MDIVILNGVRTPFGDLNKTLKDYSAIDLGVIASKEAIKKSGIWYNHIDQVILGNVQQSSADAHYFAREIGLRTGINIKTPALTVNRLCGSGLQAIISGYEQIILGNADFVLAGGAESMTQCPYTIRGIRQKGLVPKYKLEDFLNLIADVPDVSVGDYLTQGFYHPYAKMGMMDTAEKLAEMYHISRDEQDEFAYRSWSLARKATDEKKLLEEIVPVNNLEYDEHIRDKTSLEDLNKLRPATSKGYVTAGNASGICDGAAAVVVASKDAAERNNAGYLGRLVSYAIVGVKPTIMGIGPIPAIREALKKADLKLKDIGLFEINEAFAAQYIAVERELGLDRNKVNVNGGAIAIGHPLAASGARLTLTLLYEMRRKNIKYGIASLCIGGGMGIAAIFENTGVK